MEHAKSVTSEKIESASIIMRGLNYFSILASILCYASLIYIVIFNFELVKAFFDTDFDKLRTFITPEYRWPIFAVLLFFNCIISINPLGQIVPITAIVAFFYGIIWGLIFGGLTILISTLLTLYLSREFGKKAVKKIVGEKNWDKIHVLANEEGAFPFFIAHLFPIFPDPIVVWVAGITEIKISKLVFVSFWGRMPGTLLTVIVGSGLIVENFFVTAASFVLLVSIAFIMSKQRKRILKLMNQK